MLSKKLLKKGEVGKSNERLLECEKTFIQNNQMRELSKVSWKFSELVEGQVSVLEVRNHQIFGIVFVDFNSTGLTYR